MASFLVAVIPDRFYIRINYSYRSTVSSNVEIFCSNDSAALLAVVGVVVVVVGAAAATLVVVVVDRDRWRPLVSAVMNLRVP
jgi:hypothetical protein